MEEIRRRGEAGETGLLLIVPEQYSHNAERQLSAVCGDRLSLYGEITSFSRLCGSVFSETGGAPSYSPDSGGHALVMYRALGSVASHLKLYGIREQQTDLLENLLDVLREFKSLNISPEMLDSIAGQASRPLCDKLHDLSLIFRAYDSLSHVYGCDNFDRLGILAEMIGDSSIGESGHIYLDGFNDFTTQEQNVIERLFEKGADLTICLTCDMESENSEAFELPRKTVGRLRRLAGKYSVQCTVYSVQIGTADEGKAEELVFLERYFFGNSLEVFPGQCDAISIFSAPTQYTECEHAAFLVREMVSGGYRWRDIGVLARNWDEYGEICESVFEKYNIPFFSSGRADILDKPLAALIDSALEIAVSGWEYGQVFKYLKTGLSGVAVNDIAEFENYVLKWNIRGSMWTREWTLPPHNRSDGSEVAVLTRINALRRMIVRPLEVLRERITGLSEAGGKLQALLFFFEDIDLSGRLSEKADELVRRGDLRFADEYSQLWGIIINAMEQFYAILGDTPLGAAEFRKLFLLTLSQYDVGVIPVSLDRAALGGMAMSRRRDLKCLILLGATDGCLPMMGKSGGVLSDREREELSVLGADIPAGAEDRFAREMNMLYSTLTMPSQKLAVTYPTGGEMRPSYIIKRFANMFNITETKLREEEYMAASGAAYVDGRENLSASVAKRLYGGQLLLSASRVDKYYLCPYKHFLQSGLRLDPQFPAAFDAPAAGVFVHYVLEGACREIKMSEGFKSADEKLCRDIIAELIKTYIHEELFDFEGKTERFKYLFHKLEEDAVYIVLDMLNEIKESEFEPLDFELDFSFSNLKGVVDRVDGWVHEGKLFIRVIDYKTGKTVFDMSDVLNGRNMQMLIYLFALQEHGVDRYGMETSPAGVLYVPARSEILKLPRNSKDEEINKRRNNELRRSGLVLDDPAVLDAMERGDVKKYLPVRKTKDGVSGENLASPEQIGLLSEHIRFMLDRAAGEILGGSIKRSPYYRSQENNACLYCEYHPVCAFDENSGDRRRFVRAMKASEVWEVMSSG